MDTSPLDINRDDRRGSRITTGVLLIVLGLIFLGERTDVIPHVDLHRLWPVLLLVIGAGQMASGWSEGRPFAGVWLMLVGVLFLLSNYHVLDLSDSWPLFIVAGGLSLVFGGIVVRVATGGG